jgi:DNA repair exonuclease SbcCD ATPase subunit
MSSIQISESSELSLKQLQNKEILIQKELADLNDEITGIKNNIDALSRKADIYPELESEKERLEEELNIDLKKHDLLEKTIKYLENAKEQFSTRYLVDMNNGFNKYINLIDPGFLEAASMDVKLNVKIEEFGSKRDIDYFSEGYKDVIGICSRLALVDALFKNESPFIILDDPFANLDEEKLANALSLMEQTSSKYQIIYLICHKSRIHSTYFPDILKENSQFFL